MLKSVFSFKLLSRDIAIDLGTTNTLIYKKGEGIVLNAPSALAIDKKDGKVLGIGFEAKQMLGKTPQNILAIRPLQDGVIADFDTTHKMIEYFLHKVQPRKAVIGPRLVIGVPSQATKVEKRALVDIAKAVGARKVALVAEPVAAVIGADLPISEPVGNMIVDIGGGTSEAAITSLNGVVISNSIRIAGDEMDQIIIQYLKEKYNFFIGEQMAERIKITLGYLPIKEDKKKMKIRGRDLNTGFPTEIELSSEQMKEILDPVVTAIVDMVEATLEQCPPELAGDVMENGIYLTGGGSCLKGLDRYISSRIKLPVKLVPEPLLSVVLGLGKLLEDHRLLSAVEVTPNTI
ncbi:rod shape-determining protein [Candidatus Aerophobetes bacterium]|nr:rod shape-determining protein [Candidatus Aerophobetes bacterium]